MIIPTMDGITAKTITTERITTRVLFAVYAQSLGL